jgi:hypothetical protein
MIFLLGIALILTAFGFARKTKEKGFLAAGIDSLAAAAAGLLAGIFIGVGARLGMSAISFANGDLPRFSASGTLQVILVFSSFGIGLGLFYELLLRDYLRKSGWLFGLLLTLILWIPLAQAGIEILRFQPSVILMVFFSGLLVALMWLPFAVTLEFFLQKWHRRSENLFLINPVGKSL